MLAQNIVKVDYSKLDNILENGVKELDEKTKEIINSLSMVVTGGGYPLNYYELGQDDAKVKNILGDSVKELKDPMLVFVKNGSIVGVKEDFSNFIRYKFKKYDLIAQAITLKDA